MLFPLIFFVLILIGILSFVLIRLDTPVTRIIVRIIITLLILVIVATVAALLYIMWILGEK
ncbi:hypothetical protein [uncultured Enterococcus sp.]|uniref:hypothetical protein n=1 Tax=uncultured Enterococcus sp. TaxID=167972 RepID=UPI002AA8D100|nr:hypothetical protein [uncultured Enterococcus sp.]